MGIAGQEEPRRLVVPVGVGARFPGEFADTSVSLIAEADTVNQPCGNSVITQQRGPVGELIERGGVGPAGFGDRLPHLVVQTFDQAAVGLPVRIGVAVLREHVRCGLVLSARDELRLDAGFIQGVTQK